VPADSAVLGFFGLLNRSKGFDTLLHAVRRMRDQGRAVSLLVMGERAGASDPTNRAYGADMDALAAKLGLTGALHWTGYLDETTLSRSLRAVDACALPFTDGASYRNGTLLAALANGVPLVTSMPQAPNVYDGLPVLADGEQALLTLPGDADGLATALARLLNDGDLRLRLASEASAMAQAFSWEGIAAQHMALYGEVLGQPAATVPA